ncbi:hypothetical protein BRADI_1g59995v3 [Brachypodium distachyon]|uniref:Uncharacterized protein n=1 Tax=Brachypodium distachyon TaxID=15368 RepID=A0A2K2DSK3_BRADI|nr:hypothetical protein BRADI_1g59995v3 [Brachypodium distachyon]
MALSDLYTFEFAHLQRKTMCVLNIYPHVSGIQLTRKESELRRANSGYTYAPNIQNSVSYLLLKHYRTLINHIIWIRFIIEPK